MKKLNMGRRPKDDQARNTVHNVGLPKGTLPEDVDLTGPIELNRNKQPLRYYEGQPESDRNKPYLPEEANSPNDLGAVVDLSTKTPYGHSSDGYCDETDKLGDLREKDAPAWKNTWSPLVSGKNGFGYVNDENYGAERPRDFQRQDERFKENNPEFESEAYKGDWTSYKWSPNV